MNRQKPSPITIIPAPLLSAEEFDALPTEQEGCKRVLVKAIMGRMPDAVALEEMIRNRRTGAPLA